MKKKLIVVAGALILSIAVIAPIRMQSLGGPSPAAAQEPGPGRGERHPEIRRAIRALENAKRDLQSGAHDFGGHRAKALEHVNQALEECHAALQADKK